MNSEKTQTLLQQRYGTEASSEIGQMGAVAMTEAGEAVVQTLLRHKSVRRFQDRKLPTGMLELLVACGQSAATSSNLQAWSVVAVQEPGHKDTVATLCGDQNFIRAAPLFLVFCADLARLTDVSAQTGQLGEGLAYTEMFLIAVIDAALAAQNIAVAAEGLGLGICYVGAARNQPRELAQVLQLPRRVVALFGLAIGWPEPIPDGQPGDAIKPRLPLKEILHRETYNAEERPAQLAEYDATMQAFYTAQAMKVRGGWSDHSAKRVASAESLAGRHILREILEERGFDLK